MKKFLVLLLVTVGLFSCDLKPYKRTVQAYKVSEQVISFSDITNTSTFSKDTYIVYIYEETFLEKKTLFKTVDSHELKRLLLEYEIK